ncbi:hypothetical protein LCGC14_1315630 [marine sediment metagenome]|uniref:Uncharacterized protein n=1 Tax=marine sediment metagenome TaxID=412755 RepID=A0A0F9L6A3_9ZZZZ
MLYEKLKARHEIRDLRDKIKFRLNDRILKIGNKIQLSEIKIIQIINGIILEGKACEYCNDLYPEIDLREVKGDILCEKCIDDSFSYCDECNDYEYRDKINILNDEFFCEECYYLEKQDLYSIHIIKNKKLKALARLFKIKHIELNYKNLKLYTFTIDKNLWNIETYANNCFRLGSWGANSWIDIGKHEIDLLGAIDYNLGYNRDKLTKINKG